MGLLVDYFSEKKKRLRASQFRELMSDAEKFATKEALNLTGVLVVFKFDGEKSPDYRYSQEGFTREDLEQLLSRLAPATP